MSAKVEDAKQHLLESSQEDVRMLAGSSWVPAVMADFADKHAAAEVKRALVPLADAAEKTLARLHNLGYAERGYMCRELQDALAAARAELEGKHE